MWFERREGRGGISISIWRVSFVCEEEQLKTESNSVKSEHVVFISGEI